MPGSRWWNWAGEAGRLSDGRAPAPACPPRSQGSTHRQHGVEEVGDEGGPTLHSFLCRLQVSH